VLDVAFSPAHVAVALASGKILLFSTATCQPAAALELPAQLARGAAAVACSFARCGTRLVASYKDASGGGLLATWDVSNMQQPALLGASLRACHRCGCRAGEVQHGKLLQQPAVGLQTMCSQFLLLCHAMQ